MKAKRIIIACHVDFTDCINCKTEVEECDTFFTNKIITGNGHEQVKKFIKLALEKKWITNWEETYCAYSTAPEAILTMKAIKDKSEISFSRFHCDDIIYNHHFLKEMIELVLKKAEEYRVIFLVTHMEQVLNFFLHWAKRVWGMEESDLRIKHYRLLDQFVYKPLSIRIIDVNKKSIGYMDG